MIFRIANDFYAASVGENHIALGNRIHGVVGSLGLNVRTNFTNDSAHIELRKNHHCVHCRKCGDDFGALVFRNNRTSFGLERSHRCIGVNGDHQFAAQCFRRGKITNVPDMQQIERTVREDDAIPRAPPFLDSMPQFVPA